MLVLQVVKVGRLWSQMEGEKVRQVDKILVVMEVKHGSRVGLEGHRYWSFAVGNRILVAREELDGF